MVWSDGTVDVVVVGAGPAGWAVADACARRGLETALVAPEPLAPWPATYAVWAEQTDLPRHPAAAVRAAGRELDHEYAVLDNTAALARLSAGEVTTVADAAVAATRGPRGTTVELASGRRLACRVAVDASGARRVLSRPVTGPRAEQTAYGLVFPAEAVAALVPPGHAIFMDDWSTQDGLATFLYAVPLPGGRALVEETSLVARPGVPVGVLRERLLRRLATAGVDPGLALAVEGVRFPMDLPRSRIPAIGAAAGLVHPTTGYSVADSLALAPRLADALVSGGPDPVWTPAARAVRALRSHGARVLRTLPAEALPDFFAEFFTVPGWHAYLTARDDLPATAAVMARLFRAADWPLRTRLATGGISRGRGRA